MTIESNQTRFNHENWIGQLYKFMDTASQFLNEIFNGLTVLLKKRLLQIWNDIRFVFKQLTPQDFIITALITTIGMFGVIIFMTGLGLFAYQTILWLQEGIWTEFPLFVVFNFIFDNTAFQQWMLQPESWFGLQKLFSWFLEIIPLSAALMIPGISLALFMATTLLITFTYRFYQLRNRND